LVYLQKGLVGLSEPCPLVALTVVAGDDDVTFGYQVLEILPFGS
jgi:hypothetical protein